MIFQSTTRMASPTISKAESQLPHPLHIPNSSCRIEPASSEVKARPQRIVNIASCGSPEPLSPAKSNVLEKIGPRSNPDASEKGPVGNMGARGEDDVENATEKLSFDLDELPIELISLADRLVGIF
jgi:hypothetical protein